MMSEIRNPDVLEWSTISEKKLPVYARIRNLEAKRFELINGVIVARPYLADFVVFEANGETYDVFKDDIFIDDKLFR